MIGHGAFDRWSDAILHALNLELFRPLAQPYLTAMEPASTEDIADNSATENELAMSYRRVLAAFVDAALPFVTPSSFLVDIENRYATEQMGTNTPTWSVEELARLAIGTSGANRLRN